MDINVFIDRLMEPRVGFRFLEWFLALGAFATCASFSTTTSYIIRCKNMEHNTIVSHEMYYPFKLDPAGILNPSDCYDANKAQIPPGHFLSAAQYFVLTGVIALLGATACLIIHVFFSQKYLVDNMIPPMIDFWFTVIVTVMWLTASFAWAHRVISMKSAADGTWLHYSQLSPCLRDKYLTTFTYVNQNIIYCIQVEGASFAVANVSVLLGFINFIFWITTIFFIYKDTRWFIYESYLFKTRKQM